MMHTLFDGAERFEQTLFLGLGRTLLGRRFRLARRILARRLDLLLAIELALLGRFPFLDVRFRMNAAVGITLDIDSSPFGVDIY
jgi:hypothetical protein